MVEGWGEESAGRSGVTLRLFYLVVGLLVGVALGYGLWGYRVRQIAAEIGELKAYILDQTRMWTQELATNEGRLAEAEAQLQRLREAARNAPPPSTAAPGATTGPSAPAETRAPPATEPPPPGPELPPRPRTTPPVLPPARR